MDFFVGARASGVLPEATESRDENKISFSKTRALDHARLLGYRGTRDINDFLKLIFLLLLRSRLALDGLHSTASGSGPK